jgi:hypothetical protein
MEASLVGARQHDDHIWLTVAGSGWAIQAIIGNCIYLWRGYWPDCEYNAIDMSDFNYEVYCNRAVETIDGYL